jgi:hypothetical protein
MGSTMDCSSLEAAFICIRGSRSGRAVCSCALPVAHAGCESIPYADDRQTRLSYPSCPVALRPPPPRTPYAVVPGCDQRSEGSIQFAVRRLHDSNRAAGTLAVSRAPLTGATSSTCEG